MSGPRPWSAPRGEKAPEGPPLSPRSGGEDQTELKAALTTKKAAPRKAAAKKK